MRKLEQFWFKYFSYATKDNEDSWVRWAVATYLSGLASVGIIADVLGVKDLAEFSFTALLISFAIFGTLWIIVWIYHNIRLRRNEGN